VKELVGYIARALVDNPDAVAVTEETQGDRIHIYVLRVAPEDMGRIIGRQGRMAKALRTLVKAAATKEGKKALVEIAE